MFGARAACDVKNTLAPRADQARLPAPEHWAAQPVPRALRETMSAHVGIERDAEGLSRALDSIAAIERAGGGEPSLLNVTAAAALVASAALARRESRGGHYRADYPETAAPKRTFLTLAEARTLSSPFTGEVSRRAAARRRGEPQAPFRHSLPPSPRHQMVRPTATLAMCTIWWRGTPPVNGGEMSALALPNTNPPSSAEIESIVRRALDEDLGGKGDITTDSTIPETACSRGVIAAREPGVVCGLVCADPAFHLIDANVRIDVRAPDGSTVAKDDVIAEVEGPSRALLTGERTALNFIGHLSGIATATRAMVERVKGTKARILDTRKTTPGLRMLEKYAVRCGGGTNHRLGLFDAVLIKDNHILAAGGIREAVGAVRARHAGMPLEVEVDSLAQLEVALSLAVEKVLLDNMDTATLARAVALTKGRASLEASGGVTLDTVRAIAETGVDFISSGALTHSARNLDVALDFET